MKPITWAFLVALFGWTTLMSFYHLDGGARFEPIDCWVAQTAREMQDAGDYLVPRFSGETRMQKSPGPYWAVMLVSAIRNTSVDEFSARLPNACAGVALVLTIFWLTRRIADDRAAIFAGFTASASALILWWTHRAASDLGLTACTTISLATLWVAAESEPPGKKRIFLFLTGFFFAGLGMLYKMPMPLVVVGLPIFLYLLIRNRWRVLANRYHIVGLLLFLLPWLPWAIAVMLVEPNALAKWKVEFWDRFTGDLPNVAGQRAWFFHFIYLVPPIIFCLPFSLSLPGAILRACRPRPPVRRDGALFLLIWFFSHFIFFTVSAGKEFRYLLPAIPPLLALLGIELAAFFNPQRRSTPRLDRAGLAAVCVGMPLAFVGGAFGIQRWFKHVGQLEGFAWTEVWQPYAVTAVIFTLGAILAAWLYQRRREHASFAALVGTMYLTWAWVWPSVMPIFVSQRPFIDFATQLEQRIDPGDWDKLRQIGSQDPRITWYSNVRFPRLIDQLKLLEMQGGQRSLEREREIYGQELVDQLSADELILLVASRPHYIDFLIEAPPALAEQGRPMPPAHLWLQTHLGSKGRHYVIFGNQPPPWPEPRIEPPSERLDAARAARSTTTTRPSAPTHQLIPTRPTSTPTTQPAATP